MTPINPSAPGPASAKATGLAAAIHSLQAWARPRWQQLAPRERRAVTAAAWVCAAGLLWWLALAPALTTLRQAPAQHAQLDAQLSHMRQLSALATHLQAQPVRSSEERLAALQADTRRLLGDTARVRVSGEQVTVSVGATHPDTLAQWLADVRANARLTPAEARLSRTTGPASTQAANRPAPAAASTPAPDSSSATQPVSAPEPQTQAKALWQGELVFALGNSSGR